MVSVFFYCSSPYVGYTLKQAEKFVENRAVDKLIEEFEKN